MDALRDAFSGANLRSIIGMVDRGRVLLARFQRQAGDVVESDGRDALVHLVDVLHELPLMARLFIPMNILWRKPAAGEHAAVVVPADLNGPGGPYALYGDAGADGAMPSWWGTKAGLYVPETAVVQSKDGDVELEVKAGQKIKLGAAATKGVIREGDPIDCGTVNFNFTPGSAATLSITYTPPSGMGPVQTLPSGTGNINLKGKAGTGSVKVKAED